VTPDAVTASAWTVLRTPRWIGLSAVAVLAIGLCILGGIWQWTRTQDILALERSALASPVPVQDLTAVGEGLPPESVGRPVTVSGSYRPAEQIYVTSRSLDGQAGLWAVAPVTLADGTSVAILRGWVPAAEPATDQPPAGPVVVSGVLQPAESFYQQGTVVADGRLVAITDEALASQWGDQVRAGFVVLADQDPASPGGPRPVPPTVATADVAFPLQNFFYAFQWWFFAGFVVFVWVRWFRLDLREAREPGEPVGAVRDRGDAGIA
jgi:cytochrome oxidase assembly protein ShyY1